MRVEQLDAARRVRDRRRGPPPCPPPWCSPAAAAFSVIASDRRSTSAHGLVLGRVLPEADATERRAERRRVHRDDRSKPARRVRDEHDLLVSPRSHRFGHRRHAPTLFTRRPLEGRNRPECPDAPGRAHPDRSAGGSGRRSRGRARRVRRWRQHHVKRCGPHHDHHDHDPAVDDDDHARRPTCTATRAPGCSLRACATSRHASTCRTGTRTPSRVIDPATLQVIDTFPVGRAAPARRPLVRPADALRQQQRREHAHADRSAHGHTRPGHPGAGSVQPVLLARRQVRARDGGARHADRRARPDHVGARQEHRDPASRA